MLLLMQVLQADFRSPRASTPRQAMVGVVKGFPLLVVVFVVASIVRPILG